MAPVRVSLNCPVRLAEHVTCVTYDRCARILDIPHTTRDLDDGFGYQDWQWNIETMAAGWRHVIARDTIIFKRRRDDSLVVQNQRRQAMIRTIESMAIDRVSRLAMGTALEGYFGAMAASTSAPIAAGSASASGAE
jgi:hypothetical protein